MVVENHVFVKVNRVNRTCLAEQIVVKKEEVEKGTKTDFFISKPVLWWYTSSFDRSCRCIASIIDYLVFRLYSDKTLLQCQNLLYENPLILFSME